MSMHVCMCVYMYVCVHVVTARENSGIVCVYVCMHACVCMYIYIYICVCVHMYVCMYVCAHIHVSVHMCVCVCMCIHVYAVRGCMWRSQANTGCLLLISIIFKRHICLSYHVCE